MTANKQFFKNGFLVTPNAVVQSGLLVQNGKIKVTDACPDDCSAIDISGKYILPGFVDIHFHGYNLFDFTFGQYDQAAGTFDGSSEAYHMGFKMLSENLARFGVTGVFLGSDAATLQVLNNCFSNLACYLENRTDTSVGTRIWGGLIEGSFINPQMCGAMNSDRLLDFSLEAFNSIQDRGAVKLANVVPDMGQKSLDLIKSLTDRGIVVGAGHTNATAMQFEDAIGMGLKYCLHFTNGPTGGSYKPFNGGGAVEAVLQNDSVYAELIADGYHVNPSYIRDIIKRKGVDRIIGITDCMFVADSEVKTFEMDGVFGAVSENGEYLMVKDKANTLFGSNLTMGRAFENMVNWLTCDMKGIWYDMHEALSLEQALISAAKIYSSNPCKLSNLDVKGFGVINDDANADFVVIDMCGCSGGYNTSVELTVVNGNMVFFKKP